MYMVGLRGCTCCERETECTKTFDVYQGFVNKTPPHLRCRDNTAINIVHGYGRRSNGSEDTSYETIAFSLSYLNYDSVRKACNCRLQCDMPNLDQMSINSSWSLKISYECLDASSEKFDRCYFPAPDLPSPTPSEGSTKGGGDLSEPNQGFGSVSDVTSVSVAVVLVGCLTGLVIYCRCKKCKTAKVKVFKSRPYEGTMDTNSGLQPSYDYCQSPIPVIDDGYLEPRPAASTRDTGGRVHTNNEADEFDTHLDYISLRSGSGHMYNNDTHDQVYCNTEFSNRISIKPPLPCKNKKTSHTYAIEL